MRKIPNVEDEHRVHKAEDIPWVHKMVENKERVYKTEDKHRVQGQKQTQSVG
jgi:hypothetical protein